MTLIPALMDKATAAQYLSVSVSQIERMIAAGAIKTKVFSRNGVRIPTTELDQWIENLPSGQSRREKQSRRPGARAHQCTASEFQVTGEKVKKS